VLGDALRDLRFQFATLLSRRLGITNRQVKILRDPLGDIDRRFIFARALPWPWAAISIRVPNDCTAGVHSDF